MKKNKKLTRRRNNKRKKTTKSKYLNSKGGSSIPPGGSTTPSDLQLVLQGANPPQPEEVARLSNFPIDLDTLMMDDMLPISDTSDTSDKNSLIRFKEFYEKKKDNHIDNDFIKYIKQKHNIS